MEPWQIAIVLRPLGAILFMAIVVAPIAWVLYQLIPNGRLKVFLFQERSPPPRKQTPEQERRDLAWTLAFMLALLALWLATK